mmetsp:Transcript_32731/g.79633  ORF Transcript_32731/g.79633 Transcript_32731/m.79633 type:complete len:93 (-) Transcript_32731:2223-2501(-)
MFQFLQLGFRPSQELAGIILLYTHWRRFPESYFRLPSRQLNYPLTAQPDPSEFLFLEPQVGHAATPEICPHPSTFSGFMRTALSFFLFLFGV